MIKQGLTNSFLSELLTGVHQSSDVYRMALYTSKANLGPDTKAYTTDGEVTGGGYRGGGLPLVGYRVSSVDGVGIAGWDSLKWPNVSVQARGALIYNFTRGNKAVAVLDFEKDITSTNGDFMVTLPEQLLSIAGGM